MYCDIINVFAVTFGQYNTSMMNKMLFLFSKLILVMDWWSTVQVLALGSILVIFFHLQFSVCYRAHDASVYGHILGLLSSHDDPAHRSREGAKTERGERIDWTFFSNKLVSQTSERVQE